MAFALALATFLVAAEDHAIREYGLGLLSLLDSKEHMFEFFLFISPCVIYLITVLAYYKFIITYTGEIAGWSFAGFLAASFCCSQLLEAAPNDWSSHIVWVYVLFLTYVWWDAVMLIWLLPRAKKRGVVRAEEDEKEIYNISSMINWPTLGGLLLIWIFLMHTRGHEPSVSVGSYVDGIIAFHLLFASCVAVLNINLSPLVRDETPRSSQSE